MIHRAILLFLALLAPLPALAQGAIQQSGPVTPFHMPAWYANGYLMDGGSTSTPYISALGLFGGSTCPLGVSSQTGPGLSTAPYGLFTVCQTAAVTTLTVQGVNGQATPSLNFNIGGTSYPFLTAPVSIANGGTGQTSASTALNALLPAQVGSAGRVLETNGTNASWQAVSGGSGTVTSITAGTGLNGGTITTSGTISVNTGVIAALGNTNTWTGPQTFSTAITAPAFTSSVAGLAPASGGGTTNFLRADGSWATPAGSGGGTVNSVTCGTGLTGGTITNSGTCALDVTYLATTSHAGLLSTLPGGTTTFLRADGTFATPAGGGSGTVTSVATGLGLTGGPVTSSGTLAIDTSVVPQLGSANSFSATNTFTNGITADGTFSFNGTFGLVGNFSNSGTLTSSSGFGANCTPGSGVQSCFSQTSSTGGVGLQGFRYDSFNGTGQHYGSLITEVFSPTAQPSSIQFLDPDGVLGQTWSDPTVSFCVTGGSPCSSNWNIAATQGVFGQGYVWESSTGLGLTYGWSIGAIGAAQLGNGAGTGEGTVRNLAALVADMRDTSFFGDSTTKGTVKNIIGLDLTDSPCDNSNYTGMGTPNCFGILFDTYFDDELHAMSAVNAPNGGSIASIAQPITVKTYNGNDFQIWEYAGAPGTSGSKTLDCTATCNLLGATGGTNAPTGYVGEYISSTLAAGSAVPVTTGTPLNVTSISLSAGDWDVTGTLIFTGGTGAISTDTVGWTSTTSATQPTFPNNGGIANLDVTTPSAFGIVMPVGQQRLVLTSTTTVYLGMAANFAGGTASAYGFIGARRAH